MELRDSVRFYLNADLIELRDVSPQQTVLDFLRLDQSLKGTKEGCAEGDCGACTVLIGRLDARDELVYETINSCIRFVASLDGTHLVTVEHLSGMGAQLHPVQQAMVDHGGSQCGFCTPGIVMSLYGQWLTKPDPSEAAIERSLQGNLCRCTGYASIIHAAQAIDSYGDREADPLIAQHSDMAEKLRRLQDNARVVLEADGHRAILPASLDDLAAVLEEIPNAVIVAGSTDVGLWVTKQMRDLPTVVFLSRVKELQTIATDGKHLLIGAGVSYAEAQRAIVEHFPHLAGLWDRIGGQQVRNAGTIGGNIANGSPIGDTPPTLIALGATIMLRLGAVRRVVALEDFFIAYGEQDRRPGEFVESIAVPLLAEADRCAVYKVTKRFDEDISSVLGAFRVRLENGVVTDAVIAYGGMAGTPKRARLVEQALLGRPWTRATVEAAMAAYDEDFQPLSDWRASAPYRMLVAKNLLLRFWGETTAAASMQVRELIDG